MQSSTNDAWKEYSFVIVRVINQVEGIEPTYKITVKSEYILKACKDVIQSWPGISWHSDPLELDPELLIAFHPHFLAYAESLQQKKRRSEEDTHTLNSVNLLNSTIADDYRVTLATINRLISHCEITYNFIYAILIPRSIMVARCAITGLPRLFRLTSWQRVCIDGTAMYQLQMESVDLVDRSTTRSVVVGKVQTVVHLRPTRGTVRIDSLDAYPIKFHPDEKALRETITKRGKKWVSLIGVHHKEFDGVAAVKSSGSLTRQNVRSRIMVDRASFRRLNPNYQLPIPIPPRLDSTSPNMSRFAPPPQLDAYGRYVHPPPPQLSPVPIYDSTINLVNQVDLDIIRTEGDNDTPDVELTDEDLLLTPTVVFGFSLNDKIWLEFNVEKIQDIEWNTDAFNNLVLPHDHKYLLKSLVEAHHKDIGFDDFIKGKGHGLVVNLFGPPGVGKTFSAEATSELVRRPLYVVGGGDLGTKAAFLDMALQRILDVATDWKAIVLIDEADVFLEQRSMNDLERNAMVAVFLRHVEYYRGILFLTTNRVRAFDEAFLSRIHVALHFKNLSEESKIQVWTAFISKIGASASITPEQITMLAKRDVNGRQIKNAARTAQSLAAEKGEQVTFEHLSRTLDVMEEFAAEFGKKLR
jgi:hypothetical protein